MKLTNIEEGTLKTSENENKEFLTKKNQPIKTITQQDINAL